MKTVKVKLSFSPETNWIERTDSLTAWADKLINGGELRIIDMRHFTYMSYIIFENTYFRNKNKNKNNSK